MLLVMVSVGLFTTAQNWDEIKTDDNIPINFPIYDLQRNSFDLDEDQQTMINLVMSWERAFLKEKFIKLEALFSLPFYADQRIATNLAGFREITKSWFDRLIGLKYRVEGEELPIEITMSRISKTKNTGLENQVVGFMGPLRLTPLDYVIIVKYQTRETTFLVRNHQGLPKIVGVF